MQFLGTFAPVKTRKRTNEQNTYIHKATHSSPYTSGIWSQKCARSLVQRISISRHKYLSSNRSPKTKCLLYTVRKCIHGASLWTIVSSPKLYSYVYYYRNHVYRYRIRIHFQKCRLSEEHRKEHITHYYTIIVHYGTFYRF